MIWSRNTWRDGVAVCEEAFTTYWRHVECGKYELRYFHRAATNRLTTCAKVNQSWTYLPDNWGLT